MIKTVVAIDIISYYNTIDSDCNKGLNRNSQEVEVVEHIYYFWQIENRRMGKVELLQTHLDLRRRDVLWVACFILYYLFVITINSI